MACDDNERLLQEWTKGWGECIELHTDLECEQSLRKTVESDVQWLSEGSLKLQEEINSFHAAITRGREQNSGLRATVDQGAK